MGESNERASCSNMGSRSRESMEGYRRKPRRDTVHRVVCGVQEVKGNIETRERLALTNKVNEEEHFEIDGGFREEI